MKSLGIDLGSAACKAVLLEDGSIASSATICSGRGPVVTSQNAINEVLTGAGLHSLDEVDNIVSTGYGRRQLPISCKDVSEISCHARSAYWLLPSARTVLDIGGQDCKAISIGDKGKIVDFVMNDKCAAGTGRFFESMARALDCTLEDISAWSLKSTSPLTITSQCSVFAETEVVSLLNAGSDVHDIAAAINDSVSRRMASFSNRIGVHDDIVMTGGCAKSKGLVSSLEKTLGRKVNILDVDPQLMGALGAALFAMDECETNAEKAHIGLPPLPKLSDLPLPKPSDLPLPKPSAPNDVPSISSMKKPRFPWFRRK